MFRRRAKPTTIYKVRQFIWPAMGLRRLGAYVLHRVQRLPGTPYSIAAGFACGAAASFTPLIGFHFILSVFLAWLMRANWIAAMIGTIVGNPWTFPFIYVATFTVGRAILGLDEVGEAPKHLSIDLLLDDPRDVLVPLVVGSVPLGMAMWVVIFWPLRWMVASYQGRRVASREEAMKRRVERGRATGEAVSGDGSG